MLEAGASKTRITPPVGVPMDGYLDRQKPSVGVHDHIHVRSLVIGDEENYLALSSVELLYVTRDITRRVEDTVADELSIPESSVVVAAVHNHSGPSILGFHSVPKYRFLEEYLELLPGLIASSIIEAFNVRRRARVGYGKGFVKGWTVNRRKPGVGVTDDEVLALKVEDSEGRLIASVVNFTCHAVVLGANNLLISGDYPGYLSRTVEALEGGVCLFFNGALGDVNPDTPGTDYSRVYDRSIGNFRDAVRMGRALGGEAVKILNSTETVGEAEIASVSRRVRFKLRPVVEFNPSEEPTEIEASRLKPLLTRITETISERFPGGVADLPLKGFRVGGLAGVALPGEPFVELGLRIKKESPFRATMVVGCATCELGYIPTREAFDEGGYEVLFPVCIVSPETGEIVVENALEALRSLT